MILHDFHASVSFMLAASWLTDSIQVYSRGFCSPNYNENISIPFIKTKMISILFQPCLYLTSLTLSESHFEGKVCVLSFILSMNRLTFNIMGSALLTGSTLALVSRGLF